MYLGVFYFQNTILLRRCIICFILFSVYIFIFAPIVSAQDNNDLDQSVRLLTDDYINKNPSEALLIIDSLLEEARELSDPIVEIQLLEIRQDIPQWSYHSAKVIEDLDRHIKLSKENGLESDLANLYMSKATFSARLGETERALVLLDSVELNIDSTLEDDRIRIKTQGYYLKGRILDRSGRLEEAMGFYIKTIKEAEKIDYNLKIMDVYFQLGFVNKALGNLTQAITDYEESLRYSMLLNDTTYMVYNHVFIAGALLELVDEKRVENKRQELLDSVNVKLKIASSLALDRDDPYELELLFFERSNYYEALGDFDEAILFILKSRVQSQKAENFETEMAGYVQAAIIYNKSGQYSKAIEEAKFGITIANKIGAYYYLKDFYQEIAKAAEKQNNISLAYESYKKYVAVRDSVYKEETANKVNELQTKYETEKKETEINSLKQLSQIQSLEIRQRNQVIYFTALISVFVLSIVIAIYKHRNQLKKRKQIEMEQRFLLSQLNPHFISNSLVAVQSSLRQNDIDSAESYLLTFSRLMREILENSREEKITVEDEVSMLQDYLIINQKRLDNNFEYNITIDESINQEMDKIPSMLLQPFVENAIEHGLLNDNRGHITVEMTKKNELIRVTIRDNGVGFSEIRSDTSKRSLSTTIIRERIALFNEELKTKISLDFNNCKNDTDEVVGAEVTLHLPLS